MPEGCGAVTGAFWSSFFTLQKMQMVSTSFHLLMEIIQHGEALAVSAAGGCGIGSMTRPPPPLTQFSSVRTAALLLCRPGLVVGEQTRKTGSKEGTANASV